MLDSRFVLDNFDEVKKRLETRGALRPLLDEFRSAALDEREKAREIEALRAQKNTLSEQTIKGKREGGTVEDLVLKSKDVGARINRLEEEMKGIPGKLASLRLSIPNVPHKSVPVGRGPEDNVVERVIGKRPEFEFAPEAHWDLGTRLGILDFERAAKITGSRFAVYFGVGALMERALISFMLDIHTLEKGCIEVITPFIANETSLTSTGNLPKFAEDLFKLEGYDG